MKRGNRMSTFCWLHLTDLHCGQFGQRHLWPEIRHRFFEDLDKLFAMCGPWQAVLFSGDLVQRGEAQEFEQLEQQVLGPLWEKFAQLGCQPVLLTVPGNHDLQRPGNGISKSLKPALQWLLKAESFPEIADEFFDDPESAYRQITDRTLASYVKWAAKKRHHRGHPIGSCHVASSAGNQSPGGLARLKAGKTRSRMAISTNRCQIIIRPDSITP